MTMKKLPISLVIPAFCVLVFAVAPVVKTAEAISPIPCHPDKPSCILYDKIRTTLRVHKKGVPLEKRLSISQTGYGGMFYATLGGLKKGTYSAKLGNTSGFHHYRKAAGGFRKFNFTQADLKIVPRKFTITEDGGSQGFTITVNKVF